MDTHWAKNVLDLIGHGRFLSSVIVACGESKSFLTSVCKTPICTVPWGLRFGGTTFVYLAHLLASLNPICVRRPIRGPCFARPFGRVAGWQVSLLIYHTFPVSRRYRITKLTWMYADYEADTNNNCYESCGEIIEQCFGAHLSTWLWVQLRQTCKTKSHKTVAVNSHTCTKQLA